MVVSTRGITDYETMLADDVRLLLRAKHGGILEGGDERLAELDLGAECPNSFGEDV